MSTKARGSYHSESRRNRSRSRSRSRDEEYESRSRHSTNSNRAGDKRSNSHRSSEHHQKDKRRGQDRDLSEKQNKATKDNHSSHSSRRHNRSVDRDRGREKEMHQDSDTSRSHPKRSAPEVGEYHGRTTRVHTSNRSRRATRRSRSRERHLSRESAQHQMRDPPRRRNERSDSPQRDEETNDCSETVLLRYIPDSVRERDIVQHLSQQNLQAKDIRIVKKPSGDGHVKCMCFVEFPNNLCAEMWMKNTKGIINLSGQAVSLSYCSSKSRMKLYSTMDNNLLNKPLNLQDWLCSNCDVQNYKWRSECFKCHSLKEEVQSKPLNFNVYIGRNPCNTLLISELDSLTDEKSLMVSLNSAIPSLNIKSIYIHRDPNTQDSYCFGFVEFESVTIAVKLINYFINSALECDGKIVSINFCKNNFPTMILEITSNSSTNSSATEIIQRSRLIASGIGDRAYKNATESYLASMNTNANKMSQSNPQTFPPPDMTDKRFDEKSGYYFDHTTGLYYEPNSKLFYNPLSKSFMVYDYSTNQYQLAPQSMQASSNWTNTSSNTKPQTLSSTTFTAIVANNNAPKAPGDLPQYNSNNSQIFEDLDETLKGEDKASKIAKDMEKWAKKQNLRSTVVNVTKSINNSTSNPDPEEREVQIKNDILKRVEVTPAIPKFDSSHTAALVVNNNTLLGNQHNQSSNDGISTEQHIDIANLNCLLCRRHFNTLEILIKHTKKSKLHLDNLSRL
ncbi:MAG: RNA-binding protein 5 [Marteilia pararefringens]